MVKNRLIIDAQIFQTPAFHRGMGKYSYELINAICANSAQETWSEIDIILSANKPIGVQLDKALSELSGARVVKLDLLPNRRNTATVIEHNRYTIDTYLSAGDPSTKINYTILSLMQKEIYPVFPSHPKGDKTLVFYDLIPLEMPSQYLVDVPTRKAYFHKLAELFKADKYLTISKAAANDLVSLLGIDERRVACIDGGPIFHGNGKGTFKVKQPFILMPTGNDHRKNNRRGIQGFEEFNRLHNYQYDLVVTSFFDAHEIKELKSLAQNVYFTGNISGDELDNLYETSEGLLFPAESEGLGLPILEAIEKDKPVACSYIPVFREISQTSFYYFDPYDILSISNALSQMIKQTKRVTDYKEILKKYTWANTAQKFNEASLLATEQTTQHGTLTIMSCSTSYDHTAAAQILSTHAEISRLHNIEYVQPKNQANSLGALTDFLPYASSLITIKPGMNFALSKCEPILYHVANSEAFAESLFFALAQPGIVILHDTVLHDAWSGLVKKQLVDASRLATEEAIDKAYGLDGLYMVSLVMRQKAIIVMSNDAKIEMQQLVSKVGSHANVYVLEPPVNLPKFSEVATTKSTIQSANSSTNYAHTLSLIIKEVYG